jgi:hypothetical protein
MDQPTTFRANRSITTARYNQLNHVVVGDDGEGIIALDYKVKGTIDEPDVSVNPGSLLTPGALRNIFDHPEPQPETP